MAMMLVPVSKTLIRTIYDYSTDQTALAKVLRVFLFLIPLDKTIQFHKLMSIWIAIGTVLHTFAHFMHYASVPLFYDEVSFPTKGVWITGTILCFISLWIFSAALDVVRKVKFEIFYYVHHLFGFYYVLTLMHGADWWNPNFYKYLLIPGTIYLIERFLREYKSSIPVGVESVTMLGAARSKGPRVLCIELAKVGPLESFKEGQYCELKCPNPVALPMASLHHLERTATQYGNLPHP
eukprot:TRINITY_DN3571_c0_g1_i1.p1 TRINITY_DN3571_c0_g1~~TRINITY_DN3571_c0_g1_i1.p1  ORF type:complete len:276 (+),score=40.94 TRINITY_DN3571_c0_g1_i1:120-830(+)